MMMNLEKQKFFIKRNVLDYRLLPKLRAKRAQKGLFQRFDETKSLFIHIPKTGGSAIIKYLYQSHNIGHHSAKFYEKIYGPVLFKQYYKFAIVRNPYDRLYSAFAYLSKGGGSPKDEAFCVQNGLNKLTFETFVEEWISPKKIYKGLHLVPQSYYLMDGNGQMMVDFMGRYESLGADYSAIRIYLGNIGMELKPHNRSKRNAHYQDVYSASMLEKVYKIYQQDFEVLGYAK